MTKSKDQIISICTVGDKGQIVIPANIRKLFEINTGDSLVILADKKKGIALVKAEEVQSMITNAIK